MRAHLLLLLTVLVGAPLSARADDLFVLLQTGSCPNCTLADADLVHADLRDANLNAADLRRANLSRARLDGADLREADLRFSSLKGASLQGADLRGARLEGTDFRQADLSGSLFNPGGLERSHWLGAIGMNHGLRSSASLHNAGVDAAKEGRWPVAEQLFSAAIAANPDEPLSWVARGLSRGEQGKDKLAFRDLAHAGQLFADQGDMVKANQLNEASNRVYDSQNETVIANGNGIGSALLSGALSAVQALAPIALKVLTP